jgi:hypothetical protein
MLISNFERTSPPSLSNTSIEGVASLRSSQHYQIVTEDSAPHTGGKILKSFKKALAQLEGTF